MSDPSANALFKAHGIKHPSYGRIVFQDDVEENDKSFYYKVKALAPLESLWVEIPIWKVSDTSYKKLENYQNLYYRIEQKQDTTTYKLENGIYKKQIISYGDTNWVSLEVKTKLDSLIKPYPNRPKYFYKTFLKKSKVIYKKESRKAFRLKLTKKFSAFSKILSAKAEAQIWNWSKLNILITTLLFTGLLLYFINHAKKGKKVFVRRIAGLSEVEEAVGRATEMGKPILYVSGLSTISDVATIAAINILGEVAKRTAEYATPLIVPAYDVIVLQVEREILKEAYLKAGRPDAFTSEVKAFFVTESQFAYAAAVDGIIIREKPAANFYMGMFYAESLIMTETGASTGAIQIAGTDAVTQIPFFITSCDYTLMGEELYAASAYLSREPRLLGSLKAVDFIKAIFMISIIIGAISTTFGWNGLAYLFNTLICTFPN